MTVLASNDPRHGTYNGYRNLGCRCEDCRAANAEHHRRWYVYRGLTYRNGKVIRHKELAVHLAEIEPSHGTESRYTSNRFKCRCDECRGAANSARRARSRRKSGAES